MRTLAVVVTAWLAQSPTTTINDPTVQSKKVTTTTLGSKQALDVAIITPPDARDPALLKKLDAVAGRVLGGES